MKNKKLTGVIRRFDEVGRISIPVEYRRTLCVGSGDYMEIVLLDGWVCLRPCDPRDDLRSAIERTLNFTSDLTAETGIDKETKGRLLSLMREARALVNQSVLVNTEGKPVRVSSNPAPINNK